MKNQQQQHQEGFPPVGMGLTQWMLLLLFLMLLHLPFCHSFVPPKPGSDLEATYEPVHLYRKRRNISYDYHPTSFHPEMCRYLTQEECQDADESMARHQERHRNLQRQLYLERRRRRLSTSGTENTTDISASDLQEFQQLLSKATQYFETMKQPTREEELEELEELLEWDRQQQELQKESHIDPKHRKMPNPSTGTFRVLILLMRFKDHGNRRLPQKYEYQILWNLRIRKWIIQNSYGKYDAFFDVQDWKKTDNSEKHYAFGQSGRVSQFQESFWPLLDALDRQQDWDWSPYDVDNDGYLDNLIVLHSGYAAEEGGEDCTNGRGYLDRIWSHAFSDSTGWKNEDGTIEVEGYMIASGLDLTCGSDPSKMGVMTHEYMHTFYLIDLYDYTFEGKGVGRFDIMSYPYGFANDGYIPVSLSVWAKMSIDWLDCPEKSNSGTINMDPVVTSSNGCLKIPLQETEEGAEYLLLENRQQLGFDVDFWKSGIVIYHIDEGANEQYSRGYPGQKNWPGNGKHYMVAVLPADQRYDMEKNENSGDDEDMFEVGMKLTPNNDGKTHPNTDMYQSGKIKKSGITIEIKSQNGNNFSVKIDNKGRSASSAPPPEVLSAPSKEQSEAEAMASEQFRTPDAEEYRISGKIPQLPWFDEAQQEDYDRIEVWDSQTSSGSSLSKSWRLIIGAVVSFLTAAIVW